MEINAASNAYDIIKAISGKSAQIAFLSGTINPISAENFANFLNKRFSRKIKVCATKPGDPEAVNKTKLRVIPDDSLRDEKKIVDQIVEWITKNETGNAIIFFSKKRIDTIIEKVKKRLPQQNINSVANKKQPNYVQDQLVRDYKNSLKLLGMSDGVIEDKVKKFIRERFPESQAQTIERIKNKPKASQIENPDLREAVTYGLAYIYTLDKEEASDNGKSPLTEQDKLIAADLFSNEKVNVLLATPAIGIGVNVSIRNMYIPTLYKVEGTGKPFEVTRELINMRELSQLINRTGRGVSKISGIYTPKEFVDYIRNVILSTNQNFNEVPAISFDSNISQNEFIQYLYQIHEYAKESSAGQAIIRKMKTAPVIGKVSSIVLSIFNKLKNQDLLERQNENRQRDLLNKVSNNINQRQSLIYKIKSKIDTIKQHILINKTKKSIDKYDVNQIQELENTIENIKQSLQQNRQDFAATNDQNIQNRLQQEYVVLRQTYTETLRSYNDLRVDYLRINRDIHDLQNSQNADQNLIRSLIDIKSRLDRKYNMNTLIRELREKIQQLEQENNNLNQQIQQERQRNITSNIQKQQSIVFIHQCEELIKQNKNLIEHCKTEIINIQKSYNIR